MGIQCIDCNKVFYNQSNLNRHRKIVHNVNPTAVEYYHEVGHFKCLDGCDVSFKSNTDLRNHLQLKHNVEIEMVEITFSSYNEFQVWLKIEERETEQQYEKSTGTKRLRDKTVERMYFECSRSGKVRVVPLVKKKRKEKIQGSCKLDQYCTSQIILTRNISTDSCHVKYFKNHYGHEREIEHIRLPKLTKEKIASKLIAGVSETDIIHTARVNVPFPARREDILTRKDLYNIKKSVNNCNKTLNLTTSPEADINARHWSAVTSKLTIEQSLDSFCVTGENNPNYYVVNRVKDDSCCELKCKFCEICVHVYECTCLDYNTQTTICKHIHYVSLNSRTDSKALLNFVETSTPVNNSNEALMTQIEQEISQLSENLKSKQYKHDELTLILKNLKVAAAVGVLPNLGVVSVKTDFKKEPDDTSIMDEPNSSDHLYCRQVPHSSSRGNFCAVYITE